MTTTNASDTDFRNAVTALETAQRELGQTPRTDVEARAAATRAVEAALAAVRTAKEERARANQLRVFCGLQTPFYQVVAEPFPEALPELEAAALARQAAHEAKAAERRASKAKEAAPTAPASTPKPPPPPSAPPGRRPVRSARPAPEIIVLRRTAGGAS